MIFNPESLAAISIAAIYPQAFDNKLTSDEKSQALAVVQSEASKLIYKNNQSSHLSYDQQRLSLHALSIAHRAKTSNNLSDSASLFLEASHFISSINSSDLYTF